MRAGFVRTRWFMALLAVTGTVSSCSTEDQFQFRVMPSAEGDDDQSAFALAANGATMSSEACAALGGTLASAYVSPNLAFSNSPTEGAKLVQRCLKVVPNTTCGLDPLDPSLSAAPPLNIIEPEGSDSLLITVMGGGACWSAETCGIVGPVALATNTRNLPDFWQQTATHDPFLINGRGVMDDTFRRYEIPYCTGDLFGGNNVASYLSGSRSVNFRHVGYTNIVQYLNFIKSRNPNPKRIIVTGESAGAISLSLNLSLIRDRWPTQPLQVIADSGLPYSRPLLGANFARAAQNWGAAKNYGHLVGSNFDPLELTKYNVSRYASDKALRFGLIQPYNDSVLFAFAVLVGLKSPFVETFHANTDLVAEVFRPTTNFKLDSFKESGAGEKHACYIACEAEFPERYAQIEAWVKDMVSGSSNWQTVLAE